MAIVANTRPNGGVVQDMDTRKLDLEQLLLHGAWLRRFARALVGDEDLADDVAQQTLVSAWQSPPPVDAKPRSWLARVAQNRARDQHRSDQRRSKREQDVSKEAGPVPTPEQLVGGVELHRQLADLVTTLDEPLRQTVVLRYYEGLTSAEIAKRMDVPPGTVRWRLKEGLSRIRQALDAEHGGSRKKWVLALGPLLPRTELHPTSRPTLARWIQPAVVVGLVGGVSAVLIGWRAQQQAPDAPPSISESAALVASERRSTVRAVPLPLLVPATEQEDEPIPPDGPAAADPDALIRYMLAALADGSYDDFLIYADNQLKATLTKETMELAVAALGPRLLEGYTLHSLGSLQQEEQLVYLWKLEFRDGGDDHLLRVTIKEGRASGFLIQ